LKQDGQFLIDSAADAGRMSVCKCPIAVNEGVAQSPSVVARKVAVGAELSDKRFNRVANPLRGVVLVVQMHLDLTPSTLNEFPELFDQFRAILLCRKEEAMLGMTTVRIGEFPGHRGVPLRPSLHSR
jgi:hypothetical protein